MDRGKVITHLQIIHTWAEFARERDLQFFTPKHLENIAEWTDDAIALLKEQPQVVRCKDCKHYRINTVYPGTNMIMKYCAKTGIAESNPDWFCADGERNDGERGEKYDRGYREV